jgi:hypothetical protein
VVLPFVLPIVITIGNIVKRGAGKREGKILSRAETAETQRKKKNFPAGWIGLEGCSICDFAMRLAAFHTCTNFIA